ncbi:MAG: acylneuraminate cytidylyltransferase family protein [Gallionellaceae bacterium]|jgi:N-acylneuraminate cytidylyltransferase|nr:acylneuraminate cytidylyltransferase family protein [Gallionellaceae bacterium]
MNMGNIGTAGRVLALITARGGSKGLPRKNLLPAAGRPLIAWTIAAAQESAVVDRVILSSDNDEIMDAARTWGCDVPFRRPPELATDQASSMDVVAHAIEAIPGYEYLILLQPTSPLRTGADIDAAFRLMRECRADSCVSVCEAEQSPYWMYALDEKHHLTGLLPPPNDTSRRQDLPPAYVLNGAIYIAKTEQLAATRSFLTPETVAYKMPKEKSIDIDSAEDFESFRRRVENLNS